MIQEILKRHEGLRLSPYICPAGHKTIGYGWNLDVNHPPEDIAAYLRMNGCITEDMADRLLAISTETATDNCRDMFDDFDQLSENRRAGLVDLVFNMGVTKLIKGFPSFYRAVCEGDWNRAADELMFANGLTKDRLSDYYKQVGDRAIEVVRLIREG